ncbi:MAG: hypothetical protein ACI85N_001885 [Gammaproteobacteria bacterium]|jgi:hypothetical protein
MTTHDCTANPAVLKSTPTLYPVISSSKPHHVAEDLSPQFRYNPPQNSGKTALTVGGTSEMISVLCLTLTIRNQYESNYGH